MIKLKNNQKGFSLIEAILLVAIVVLIGVVGWLVYKDHHKTTAKSAAITKQSAKPYAGWASYTTSYYKVSLKYPATWKLDTSASIPYSDGTADDAVNLTSPDGFSMNVDYGNSGACSSEYINILFNKPVEVNGTSGYFDYVNSQENTPASDVDGFFLSKQSTKDSAEQIDYGSNRLCVNGQTKSYKSVGQAQTDPDYEDALLVAKSISFHQ